MTRSPQRSPQIISCARCGARMTSRLRWPPQTATNDELEVCTDCTRAIAQGEEP